MILKKREKRSLSRTAWIFNFVIVLLVASFIVSMSAMSMTQNVESRAFAELESTAEMQASTFTHHVEEQYQALQLVADMVEHGRHFTSEKMRLTLTAIVRTFQLCTLCFADQEGNTIDYQGNVMESCSDRAYFYEIINGNSKQYCEYLETTKSVAEPRMIYSVPAYDENGDMLGIFFCSKEISVLEQSLFEHSELFDAATIVFICSETGALIAGNGNAYSEFEEDRAYQQGKFNVYTWNASVAEMGGESMISRQIELNGKSCFAACTPLGANGWFLYCALDEQKAAETFRTNQERIEKIIGSICATFVAALGYIIFLGKLYLSRKKKESQAVQRNYENYKNILEEAQCAVMEYDLEEESLAAIQPEIGKVKLEMSSNAQEAYRQLKKAHPEYDFEELRKELKLALATGKTYSFESFLTPNIQELFWLRTIIIPIPDETGAVGRTLFAIFDVSELHREGADALEMYINLPGSVYRCKLDKPAQLEYFSNEFYKMLGRTHEEIETIIGLERKYSRLICQEDRPAFGAFIRKLAIYGGTETCEYRMICANGSLLEVSDTMYAKRSATGTMYGYSIVTNLREYRQKQQALEQELDRVRVQLEQSRVKNASSQMQPHFLYNALSSIREIVLEDPQYAADLIYDFTTHLRACIRSMSSDHLISFAQEFENVKAYANIEKMRFGDRLNMVYDCQETEFDIIPLSIQPLVENAIRHGVYERGAMGGVVTLRTFRDGSCVVVCVEDDGVGFDFEKTMAAVKGGKQDSNGLYNLIFRFETLMNANVQVESEIGRGTKITVTIPAGGTL